MRGWGALRWAKMRPKEEKSSRLGLWVMSVRPLVIQVQTQNRLQFPLISGAIRHCADQGGHPGWGVFQEKDHKCFRKSLGMPTGAGKEGRTDSVAWGAAEGRMWLDPGWGQDQPLSSTVAHFTHPLCASSVGSHQASAASGVGKGATPERR